MPLNEGLGLYYHQRVAPVEQTRQRNHYQARYARRLPRTRFALLKQSELPAQEQDFCDQGYAGEKHKPEETEQLRL